MALTRCPECRKKISESAQFCPNCGFSFKKEDLEIYKQKLEHDANKMPKLIEKALNFTLFGSLFSPSLFCSQVG